MGVVFRYIYSDLGFHYDESSVSDASGASAFAADISGYYTTYPIIGRNECQWSLGFNISNIGTKVSYDGGNENAFLPTNLKIGTSFLFPLAEYNTLSLNLDLNKLLVPSTPQVSNYETEEEYEEAKEKCLAGMKILVREGSAARNVENIVPGLVKEPEFIAHFMFCTDDKHLDTIENEGHN